MLTFIATDIFGVDVPLPQPLSVTINQEENVPADDLTVVFPFVDDLQELDRIQVKDMGAIVFKGVVDEQQAISNESGAFIKIIARSMAAVLLDNESKPISYINPSVSVIFSRHLEPCGIESYKGDNLSCVGSFNVPKGSTNWQVLNSFCIKTFGKSPRIECDGTANFNGLARDRKIAFSNSNGINYISVTENNKRCNLISSVLVKTDEQGDYTTEIKNDSASDRNIKRERYIDATVNTDLYVADKIINNSLDSSYELTLMCLGCYLDIMGSKASVEDKHLGKIENLYVSGICYTLNNKGEFTKVLLKKER
ncbi:MAG: hypothetical protein ACI4RM_01905 [Ruminococcus sp.]